MIKSGKKIRLTKDELRVFQLMTETGVQPRSATDYNEILQASIGGLRQHIADGGNEAPEARLLAAVLEQELLIDTAGVAPRRVRDQNPSSTDASTFAA